MRDGCRRLDGFWLRECLVVGFLGFGVWVEVCVLVFGLVVEVLEIGFVLRFSLYQ